MKNLGLLALCLTAGCAVSSVQNRDISWVKEIDLKPQKITEDIFYDGTSLGMQLKYAGRNFLAKTDGLQKEDDVLEAVALINSELTEGEDADISVTGYWNGNHFVICRLYAQTQEIRFKCKR